MCVERTCDHSTDLCTVVSYALVCRLQVNRGATFAAETGDRGHCGLLSCMSESLLVILRNANECTVVSVHSDSRGTWSKCSVKSIQPKSVHGVCGSELARYHKMCGTEMLQIELNL